LVLGRRGKFGIRALVAAGMPGSEWMVIHFNANGLALPRAMRWAERSPHPVDDPQG
jgi:hypothetical protein